MTLHGTWKGFWSTAWTAVSSTGRRLFFAVALLGLVLVGALVTLERHALGERLVDEVARLSRSQARAVHRPPATGGTFQACVGPLLDAAPEPGLFTTTAPMESREEITAVVEGRVAPSSMSPALRTDSERLVPWALEVVACTRSPLVGEEPGMGPFAGWDEPRQNGKLIPPTIARLVALQMRSDLDSRDAGKALQRCSDILALARDTVRDRGLIGAMLSVPMTRIALQPCASAIEAADTQALRRFVDEVHVIRESSLPFAAVLEIERAEMQLLAHGRDLASGQKERLTPNARALTRNSLFPPAFDTKRIAGWLIWPAFVGRLDRLIAAAPAADRDQRFAAVEREEEQSWLSRFVSDSRPALLSCARRYDATARGLDLIESAARVALGSPALPSVTSGSTEGGSTLSVPWTPGETATISIRVGEKQAVDRGP